MHQPDLADPEVAREIPPRAKRARLHDFGKEAARLLQPHAHLRRELSRAHEDLRHAGNRIAGGQAAAAEDQLAEIVMALVETLRTLDALPVDPSGDGAFENALLVEEGPRRVDYRLRGP